MTLPAVLKGGVQWVVDAWVQDLAARDADGEVLYEADRAAIAKQAKEVGRSPG